MTRSCHGLLMYFRPRGHDWLLLKSPPNRAELAHSCRAAAGAHPAADPADAGRVDTGPVGGTGAVLAPAVVKAITFDHGPNASFISARRRHT